MRRHLVIWIVLALAALGARRASAQLMSPGPLSEAHEELEGDDNCDNCHQAGKQVVASLCLDCHKELAKRVDAGEGLHGKTYAGKACESCHVEHISRKTKLIRWPGGDRDKFDHDDAGWTLEGDHKTTTCLDCHKRTTPKGKPTFLGNKKACATCHKDPHDSRFGSTCLSCHDQADWTSVDLDKFDHDKARYPLEGGHVKVDCAKCHGAPPKYRGLAFAACDDCHQDPHKGKFAPQACAECHDVSDWKTAEKKMRKNHPGLSLKNGHAKVKCETCHDQGTAKAPKAGNACVDCHSPVHEAKFGKRCVTCHKSIEWLGLPDKIGRDAHDKTPYPLTGQHVDVKCKSCHLTKLKVDKRYRGLTFDRCVGCHADQHAGEFTARDGGECGACHTVRGFSPTTFGIDDHATTAYPLDGRHVAAPCGGCHGNAKRRVDLRVPKQACADCHANPHGEQFATEMRDGGCASCHSSSDWHQPRIDHSTWPLTGVHASAACASCHGDNTDSAKPASYRGVPRACDGCHDDTHAGQFRLADPVKPCETCHATTAFAIPAFDHEAQSGYALDGKHAETTCAGCHPSQTLRDGATTATRYRLGYDTCRDCHANPHREGGLVDDMECSACHTSTGWKVAGVAGQSGFDHDRTGFPLRGGHEQTQCTGCHTGAAAPASTCDGCHRDPHQGRMDAPCVECHTATSWDDTDTLEQHRQSRMPLTGRHAMLDCVACHQRQTERTWSDVPSDCFGCHADDYRDDRTHPDHEADPATYPRDCARCHVTSAWSPAIIDASGIARQAGLEDRAGHDTVFELSTGPHADAACEGCHVDQRRRARVRCDGCHTSSEVRHDHGGRRTARGANSCLRCHPRGVSR